MNRGDELIFFLNTGSGYTNALEITNLTVDGGRILGEIGKATGVEHPEEVLSIETYFPKGTNVATHYISYTGTDWVLARTVYEVADWRVPGNIVYRCEVKQNIPMQALVEESGISRFRQIPDEASRDQLCTKEQR